MIIQFEVPGQPQGKGRPRVFGRHAVTPEKTVIYENWIKTCFMQAKQPKLTGNLCLYMVAYFEIPKSFSKVKRQQAIDGKLRPAKKPDIDNIVKCMDALNGLAWDDDCQVVALHVTKMYSENPRLWIRAEEIEE